jgi:alpha-L-rhamnosidase
MAMQAKSDRLRVIGLQADYLDRPMGLENPNPRLSWRLESDERNVCQSAYRILVASDEEMLKARRGDLWDSGKIDSKKSIGIQYAGQRLASRQACWWSVQVWDETDRASPLSAASWWEMGLLDSMDWVAQWLEAEDPVAKADREAGLDWIWGAVSDNTRSRKFRCKIKLPAPSVAGQLFLVLANEWYGRVAGIWIDGTAVTADSFSGQWVTVQPMGAGEHLIAVEVEPLELLSHASGVSHIDAIGVFVRMTLENGETLRIGRGENWTTSLTQNAGWYAWACEDKAWEATRQVVNEGRQPWPARPAMYLRRTFALDKPVVKARLYTTALGGYEARLNGRRVGDALLTPEPAQYTKRALYRIDDVTVLLRPHVNVLGLIVGDGWYASSEGRFEWGPPPCRVLSQLELTFIDGSRQVVATAPDWRIAESPIRSSEIRRGEVYDARFEQSGWDTPEFDDSHWRKVEIAETPSCRLVAQISPPIRAKQTLKARAISQARSGTHVFDFGVNIAGWCRLRVKGDRGQQIELKFAELLGADGDIAPHSWTNMGEVKRDVYILRGGGLRETFEPHFTYRGFRYVQASGLPDPPTKETIEGVLVHSDLRMTGHLRIGHPLIAAIWRATVQAQRCNFVGIPTDCPSREQRGYMNDCGNFWDAAAFNMDVCAFSSRQMDNVVDGQLPTGAFPMLAPWAPKLGDYFGGRSPPGWGEGGIILPWMVWQRYGDVSIIERNWEAMKRHVHLVLQHNPDYLWKNNRGADFGDWLSTDQATLDPASARSTPKELIGTAYWAYSVDLLAQMGQAIGRTEDVAGLRGLFKLVRQAFIATYVTPEGVVGNGSQTSYVLALKFNLLPDRSRQAAAERLASDIRARGVALTTGFLGTQFVLDVLADAGFTDIAYGLLLRTDYPSWGYMLRQGATTLWESWSGETEWQGKMSKISQNHFSLGSICGFLFRRIAGIDASAPGFEKILMRFALDPRVKRGGGDYDSVMGRISTDWTQTPDGGFTLEATVPSNATARIHLPARRISRIEEDEEEISHRPDIRVLSRCDHEVVIEVGSGRYRFVVQ